MYIWNGSTWVKFFPSATGSVNITDQTASITAAGLESASAEVGYILDNGGQARTVEIAIEDGVFFGGEINPISGEWLTSGSASDFSVRATILLSNLSATALTFGVFNTWQSLSTTREWRLFDSSQGGPTNVQSRLDIKIDIALTSNLSNILDTATIVLQTSYQTSSLR